MAGALGLVITTDVPVSGQHAQPVYVDDSLPIVGPSRACVVTTGDIPQMGGPAIPVRLAPAGTPAVGPALPVYVVSGSLGASATLPANTVLPSISGTLNIGQLLTTTDGTWTGAPAPTFAYQWKRGGVNIGGATNNTYTTALADAGQTITVTVTATNAAGSASATSAGVVIFTPTVIAGLQFWYKADALALNDNDPVASWADSGGAQNKPATAAGAARPTYKTAIQNGLPIVRFDGTNNAMATAAFAATMAQPTTWFLVSKNTDAGTTQRHAADGTDGSNRNAMYRANSAGTKFFIFAGLGLQGDADSTNWTIRTAVFNGASSSHQVNSNAATSGNASTQGIAGLAIGSAPGGSNKWQGDIAELVCYSGVLSGADQIRVQTYLNAKWVIF